MHLKEFRLPLIFASIGCLLGFNIREQERIQCNVHGDTLTIMESDTLFAKRKERSFPLDKPSVKSMDQSSEHGLLDECIASPSRQ